MAQPPNKHNRVSDSEYYVRLGIFVVFNLWIAMGVVFCGLPAMPLRLVSAQLGDSKTGVFVHSFYRAWIRPIQAAYVSALLVLTALSMNGSALVVSGDWDQIAPSAKQIAVSNHQIYPDWFFLFIFARFRNCHADIKVILINILSRLPLFGQGMWLFEFLFMKQRFDKDRQNMARNLTTAKNDPHPLWLLIFPEGTLNTPGNIDKSRAYAKKMNINSHPNHCILPKSTGLFFCLETLTPVSTPFLFDLTVGYSGLNGVEIPYDRYLIDRVFFAKDFPREIHIHVKRYQTRNLPGFTDAEERQQQSSGSDEKEIERKTRFDEWLRGIWFEKDERMARFYKTGSMLQRDKEKELTSRVVRIPLVPSTLDWVSVIVLFALGLFLPVVYWNILKLAFAALLTFI
ncbi:hypothetical protein HK100_000323 [Physocladia obscura]|uniref:Phospholipid/glycerol acyltransferase domain-containing protein n=1 Tax=Physocladia obscura TaxID=109957 RepID=A0AAD5XCL4_9FUNG|nr:hypothetical protein HK100_000323 [Physocladia obscura]